MISKKGGNTLWATDLERNKSSASLYSIVTPQNRQTDDTNSSTAGNGVSRVASPHLRWSPPVFGKGHICSHLDFPQELRSTASSTTLPARDITTQWAMKMMLAKMIYTGTLKLVVGKKRVTTESWVMAKYRCKIGSNCCNNDSASPNSEKYSKKYFRQ